MSGRQSESEVDSCRRRKHRRKRMKKVVGLLAVLLLAVTANAAIQISYQVDGGAVVICSLASSTGPVTCPSVGGPPLDIISLTAFSNSPGTAVTTKETSATVDLNNSDTVSHTISISVAAQGFTTPVTPPNITLLSHVGGTVLAGSGANLLSYQSCVDTLNGLNTISGGIASCPAGSIASGVSAPAITAGGSFQNDQTGSISSLSAPYALDEVFTITLGAGGDINFSASTTLSSVPEPAS